MSLVFRNALMPSENKQVLRPSAPKAIGCTDETVMKIQSLIENILAIVMSLRLTIEMNIYLF